VTKGAQTHLHLDPVGGVAGDMFVAALLDAWPALRDGTLAAVGSLEAASQVRVAVTADRDHGLTGTRFTVTVPAGRNTADHVPFRRIRTMLEGSPLAPAVRRRAVDIFTILADAEGRVHGIPAEEVAFHEVGAADSIADIVAAAHLIETVGARSWSCGALPMGAGRVRSAHGVLPLPAPAVTLLLDGFAVMDDGLDGERVTPTGAAILRHLAPEPGPPRTPMRLARSGTGLGTRRFREIGNVLRVLAFEPLEAGLIHERVGVIEFEVDDRRSDARGPVAGVGTAARARRRARRAAGAGIRQEGAPRRPGPGPGRVRGGRAGRRRLLRRDAHARAALADRQPDRPAAP
jgi:uncharacterized protein (DUF111 family)